MKKVPWSWINYSWQGTKKLQWKIQPTAGRADGPQTEVWMTVEAGRDWKHEKIKA